MLFQAPEMNEYTFKCLFYCTLSLCVCRLYLHFTCTTYTYQTLQFYSYVYSEGFTEIFYRKFFIICLQQMIKKQRHFIQHFILKNMAKYFGCARICLLIVIFLFYLTLIIINIFSSRECIGFIPVKGIKIDPLFCMAQYCNLINNVVFVIT